MHLNIRKNDGDFGNVYAYPSFYKILENILSSSMW